MEITEGSNQLREGIRLLEKKLGFLSKSETPCCGITFSQCHALVEVGRAGSISLNELADILGLDNSTLSRTINNLVNNGLVQRELNQLDRRYVVINLTKDGMKVFEGIETSMNLYFKRIYKSIPENKRNQVVESLAILNEAIIDLENND
jgi:DNA-binding MarR family transcriptional regulator